MEAGSEAGLRHVNGLVVISDVISRRKEYTHINSNQINIGLNLSFSMKNKNEIDTVIAAMAFRHIDKNKQN